MEHFKFDVLKAMGVLRSFPQGVFPTGQLSVCQYLLCLEHYQWSQTPFHPVTLTEEGGGRVWGVFLLFRALAVLVGLGCSVCGPADGISSASVDGRGQGPAMGISLQVADRSLGPFEKMVPWDVG